MPRIRPPRPSAPVTMRLRSATSLRVGLDRRGLPHGGLVDLAGGGDRGRLLGHLAADERIDAAYRPTPCAGCR